MTIIDLNGPDCNEASFISFPTGERHIRVSTSITGPVTLVYKDTCPDIMRIALAVDALRAAGVKEITLYLPFVPYARQDRRALPGEPLSIKVFAALLNTLRLDEVVIVDPHSDVTPALIDNVRVIPQESLAYTAVERILEHSGRLIKLAVVAPDLGAAKKAKKLQDLLRANGLTVGLIQGDKRRDPETGAIAGFRVLDGEPSAYDHLLLVDDICDGGGTFIGLGQELQRSGGKTMSLFTTHGIYSKGVAELHSLFYNVISSDSLPCEYPKLTIPV